MTPEVKVLRLDGENWRKCHVCNRIGVDSQLVSNGGRLYVGLCRECKKRLLNALAVDLQGEHMEPAPDLDAKGGGAGALDGGASPRPPV